MQPASSGVTDAPADDQAGRAQRREIAQAEVVVRRLVARGGQRKDSEDRRSKEGDREGLRYLYARYADNLRLIGADAPGRTWLLKDPSTLLSTAERRARSSPS